MKYNKDQPQKNPKDWVTSRRPRIGWGLGFAVPTTFLVSIAACIFAARNDLQQRLIILTGNTSSVLWVQQATVTVLRVLASYLT
jgi:hypothetical protein